MVAIITLLLTIAAPVQAEEASASLPQGGRKSETQTSTRALQFTPGQKPTAEEKERIRIRIGITPQQQQQIDDLYNETRGRMDEVRKAISEAQRKLWEEYQKYDLDEAAIRNLRREINRYHWQFGGIQAENERKIRTILSREQFDKLRQVLKEEWDKRRKQFQQFRGSRPPGPPPHSRPKLL